MGLPGETMASARLTQKSIIEYLKSGLTTHTHISVLVPYPNTPVYHTPRAHGIDVISHDWGKYWMNCDPLGCGEPVYRTVDGNGSVLLDEHQIFSLWKDTITSVTDFYEGQYGGGSQEGSGDNAD
jgi:radical SAM superfamily enzyme YgiQ (UPF0313 family)